MTRSAPSRAILLGDDAAERLQRGRIAHELEQPEQAEHPEASEIDGDKGLKVPGQHREQVDDHNRPERDAELRPPRGHAAQPRNDRAPHAQHIFEAEHQHREDVERVEIGAVADGDVVHHLGGEGEGVREDEGDEEGVDHAPRGMRVSANFENVVDVPPPASPDRIVGHS